MKQRTKDSWWFIVAMLVLAAIFFTTEAYACTAFYKGEVIDGMYKICYYDHLGSRVALTKNSYELCPITVTWPH